ncbi:MAG: hypothetical protein RLZZ450_7003 [Pseudomonadota bacterium]|jgi:hypothetical protein
MQTGCYGIEARPRKINRVAHSKKKKRGAPLRADITFQLALIGGLDWLLGGRFPRADLIRAVAQVDPAADRAFHSALQAIAGGDDALSLDSVSLRQACVSLCLRGRSLDRRGADERARNSRSEPTSDGTSSAIRVA